MNTACHRPSPLCRSLTHHSRGWIGVVWSKWALFYFFFFFPPPPLLAGDHRDQWRHLILAKATFAVLESKSGPKWAQSYDGSFCEKKKNPKKTAGEDTTQYSKSSSQVSTFICTLMILYKIIIILWLFASQDFDQMSMSGAGNISTCLIWSYKYVTQCLSVFFRF